MILNESEDGRWNVQPKFLRTAFYVEHGGCFHKNMVTASVNTVLNDALDIESFSTLKKVKIK